MFQKSRQKTIDELMQAMDQMVDARVKIVHEKIYSNYREANRIQEELYDPAREKFSNLIKELTSPIPF